MPLRSISRRRPPTRLASTISLGCLALAAGCGGSSEPPNAPSGQRASVFDALAERRQPAAATVAPAPPRADASLLARKKLFANPDRATPLLSPDGKRISYLSDVDGVLNVWVGPVSEPSRAKPVTQDAKRGIRQYQWAFDGAHLVYLQDKDGDENWHLWSVDVATATAKDLTPFPGVQARIEGVSHKRPREILVGMNDRDARYHDLYRVDLVTGARTLVMKNEGFATIDADDDFRVRFVARPEKDGSISVLDSKLGPAFTIPHEDALTTHLAGFDKDGKKAFIVDSRGRETAALVQMDLASKALEVIVDDGQADITQVIRHPTTKKVQAALANYERLRWHVLDDAIKPDLELLTKEIPGDLTLASRSLDDARWLVTAIASDAPPKTYLYDRKKRAVSYLFSSMKALEDAPLAPMHPVVIQARDGLPLVSYLTLPRAADPRAEGRPSAPLPLVLVVHGGPWSRDEYGLNRWHQWLASRGYAVLSVNYRGSTGFGKKFVNAADHEWAGKMHEDLTDAVAWATKQKIADASKVAIMGCSYGGYATLVGLTFTPKTFACGVDIVGPSNLQTLLQSIPPYWESEVEQFTKRIGDHRTDEGRAFLASRSPLGRVASIERPLLIGQGKNDPRVKQAESDQIVSAMKERKIPVTYVLYPDEGHGFARPENRTSFNAVAEAFLAQCLGGPYEPIGEDFEGSSISVPTGKEHVVGLPEAMGKAP